MSRLIIKNLPKTVTVDKLKEHFSVKGVVTDVQLKYTRDGKFRHFGFVGFQTEEQAEAALNHFNNTFINTSKITVEFCAELGDARKPKAWSRYAPDSSAYKKLHSEQPEVVPEKIETDKIKKNKKKVDSEVLDKVSKHKDEPMFIEFMEAHAKDSKTVWGNDTLPVNNEEQVDSGVEKSESDCEHKEDVQEKSAAYANISDMEYLKLRTKQSTADRGTSILDKKQVKNKEKEQRELYTVKLHDLPYTTQKRDIKDFFHPLSIVSVRIPRKMKGFAYVSFKTEKALKKALLKNKSFLGGKQVCVSAYKNEQTKKNCNRDEMNRWREQEENLIEEENIGESGSIFARNLAYTVTEDDLRELFEKFGPVTELKLPVDMYTRKRKGFATVTYLMPDNAVAAYTKLDGTILHGRMLHLLPCKAKKTEEVDSEGGKYSDQKLKKQKAAAGSSHNWNTLFLGQNAIADIIAKTYKTTKEEVLTGKDAAVKMALGETQIVNDTKQFLLDNGVKLDAFNQAPKLRSKSVILVKNLPAGTKADEIRDLFAKFGELGRVILPESGVTAIVEFLTQSEAQVAFKKLAYTRFKYLPLYLEWAPEDTFEKSYSQLNSEEETKEDKEENEIKDEENKIDIEKEDIVPELDTTCYIKNINFDTDEDGIKKHFESCGKIASVTVARKKDPKKPGTLLSMGYGFVQFYTQAQLNNALKKLQGSTLDGHKIELRRSNRTLQSQVVVNRQKTNVEKQSGTKIIVRNIPFQATAAEVRQLFQTFGEIRSLRLPKKMVGTGPHRGFAFVDFYTKHDAKRAMQALCQSTHLLGRRLVLEWAENEENVELIRKRTAQHFKPKSEPKSKKSTADLEIEDMDNSD